MATEEIFSKKIACGKRTYFFNLKQQASGTRFIDIVESQYDKGEDKHHRIRLVIFEDHIDEFSEALREVAGQLKSNHPPPEPGSEGG